MAAERPATGGEGGRRPARPRRDRWSGVERELRRIHGPYIAGIDEVGRGPLAGPVVACAVVMPPDTRAIPGVDDSKQLSAAERQRLSVKIRERAVSYGIGAASVREIDRVNIYHATVIAMRRALAKLSVQPSYVLVDGKPIRTLTVEHTAIVGGDDSCYTIACASILAKVTRDRIMQSLAPRHPNYRWERNVGYSTLAHLQGLAQFGVTPHHRKSFIPVRQLSLDLLSPSSSNPDEATQATLADLAALIEQGGAPGDDVAGDDPHFAGD